MSGWDYWKSLSGSLEAASTQASKLAEVVSAQVTEQSKHIAAQASSYSAVAAQRASEYSKVAAENAASATTEARAQLAGLHLPEALANLHLPTGGGDAALEHQTALERFCLTPDLCSFVRSMTYATFRDFPQEEVDVLLKCTEGEGEEGEEKASPPLNPWQANHAKLLCMIVQEINELRFVLVPKVMDDAQFWAIYFALNRSSLPPECYDLSLQVDEQPVALDPPSRPRQPVKLVAAAAAAPEALKKEFRDFHMTPAARESDDREVTGEGGGGGGTSGWLRNLLNGFDMEVPTGERLEQDTVLLGALHSRMHQLSEGAKGMRLPEDLKQNIAANINNVRDLLGMPHDALPQDASGPSQTGGPSPEGAAAASSFAGAAGAVGGVAAQTGATVAASSQSDSQGRQQADAMGGAGSGRANDDEEERGSRVSVPLDTDPDLEAYLQEVEAPSGSGSASHGASEASASEAGDFDRYLEECATAGGNGSGGNGDGANDQHSNSGGKSDRGSSNGDSGDADDFEDLDEYLHTMTSGDGHEEDSSASKAA